MVWRLARDKRGEWALFPKGNKNIVSYAKIDVDRFSKPCKMSIKKGEILFQLKGKIMTKYAVIDRQTGEQVGKPYINKNRARARVDKLDNAYGGYRYTVKAIEVV